MPANRFEDNEYTTYFEQPQNLRLQAYMGVHKWHRTCSMWHWAALVKDHTNELRSYPMRIIIARKLVFVVPGVGFI